MKKKYIPTIIFLTCFLFVQLAKGQSIRKSFDEMTPYEITELVNAFYDIRSGGADMFNDMAAFHGEYFNFDNTIDPTRLDLHFNLPDEPEREIFLAWHRRQMFELEQRVQEFNPEISLAYWDSSIYQSSTDALWDESFLGSFDDNWNLNRNHGVGGPLPTAANVNFLMGLSDFNEFSNELERRPVHRGAHVWTGGAMPSTLSPRDPVFFFHHCWVDKIWDDWETLYGTSSFLRTDMLRYDGTYAFDGETLPTVNPNNITDTRSLGVFYGEDGLAQLDNYIVSNTYKPEEVFYYQFNIVAGNNFIVPSGAVARLESINEINLAPGFEAAPGSSFQANIDTENGSANKSFNRGDIARAKNPYPYSELFTKPIVWEEGGDLLADKIIILAAPNPFTDMITIKLNKRQDCVIEVFNMMGGLIREEAFQNTDTMVINNLYGLATGFYVIRVTDANGEILVVKRIVKM